MEKAFIPQNFWMLANWIAQERHWRRRLKNRDHLEDGQIQNHFHEAAISHININSILYSGNFQPFSFSTFIDFTIKKMWYLFLLPIHAQHIIFL
jgi:hypothetical protein